jgi:hypothetical protein
LAALLLACLALLFTVTAVGEGRRRIAVLRPDDELYRAISLSLSPWGVDTRKSDATPPAPSQPEAVQMASRLARELDVEAVVWVTSAERGSLLWVFDARAGDVTTRMLAEAPPFDSAAAASVALSVKTVLRSSAVAPPAERFGAEPIMGNRGVFALEFGALVNWLDERKLEPRIELAGTAWFALERRLGVGAEFSSGPGVRVEEPAYSGRYREFIAGAKARFRPIHEPGLSAALALGSALHWTRLEGTIVDGSVPSSVSRLSASLDLETSLAVMLGRRSYLGASMGVAYFPAYRRYLVEGTPVFSPWRLVPSLGVHFGVEAF